MADRTHTFGRETVLTVTTVTTSHQFTFCPTGDMYI